VTGIFMFFHWDFGQMTLAHEWLGWIFLLGAGAHIAANLRPLKMHLASRWGKVSVAAFATVC